ncbi:MAG: DNA-deoxyinosine glycosylase [Planctomycetota bacterium]
MSTQRDNSPRGLAPLVGDCPKVLILGSFPGVESLRQVAYYAQPRNAFWRIMSSLVGFDVKLPYDERCQSLTAAGYALWDVIASCSRNGSLDSRIDRESIVPNKLPDLLADNATIDKIIFNGRMAQSMFQRHVQPQLTPLQLSKLTCRYVPSTSPANAGVPEEKKLSAWRAVIFD